MGYRQEHILIVLTTIIDSNHNISIYVGIGDLIIDLDADIEKSSSSNLDSSLVIPLQSAANLTTPERVDKKKEGSEESNKTPIKSQTKGKF